MEKMREEFEHAVAAGGILLGFCCVGCGYSEGLKLLDGEWDGKKYRNDSLQSAWSIWKVSRAALCTELQKWVCNKYDNETMSVVDVIELIEISMAESK